MRIAKQDIPVKIDAPGAIARQTTGDFGDAKGFGSMSGEFFSMAKGTDISPLLQGLQDDLCQAPHWGYLLQGEVIVKYTDGQEENVRAGDLFYWPPGHTVRVDEDAELILFSPHKEHNHVINHMKQKMAS